MAAAKTDITIEKGATFSMTLQLKDSAGVAIDISGWTFSGKLRKRYDDAAAVASFIFTKPGGTGIVVVSMTSTTTAGIAVDPSNQKSADLNSTRYVYDISATKVDTTVARILQGVADVVPTASA